jgi:hypothetical protein
MRWLWHLYLCWVPERELLKESYRREEKDYRDLLKWLGKPLAFEKDPETPGPWWTRS